MITWLSITMLGFVLGMRHATDPDHVLAVTTIVARERSLGGAALIGALWGLGHTLTIVAVGGAIILFGLVIPTRLGLTMEFSVALMLILLGVLNLTGVLRWMTEAVTPSAPAPAHAHGDFVHAHPHGQAPGDHGHAESDTVLARLDRRFRRLGLYQTIRPVVIGVVHGLAGSAAVALLVLATIPSPLWGVLYLLVFGIGTIAGMMLITAANAVPFVYTARRAERVNRLLGLATGVASLAFGLFLVYRIGVVEGLFGITPTWTPE